MRTEIPRIVVASAMSGSGKTTATCALILQFMRQGIKVAPFKCGPDHIDPMYHKATCGRDSVNLDSFFQSSEQLTETFLRNCIGADIAICEGVMGYYDGMRFDSEKASTYDIARTIKAPVILVVKASGMAFTVVALIRGIASQFPDANIQGLILNEVKSSSYAPLKSMLEKGTGIPVVGYIPPLGASEGTYRNGLAAQNVIDKRKAMLLSQTEGTLDMTKIKSIASGALKHHMKGMGAHKNILHRTRARIAMAYDEAFCFYYKDNLDILREYGAELVPFSPIRDTALPEGASGLLLGGGYPEIYAERLAANVSLRGEIYRRLENGMPCLAESGGFMYLGRGIRDGKGKLRSGVGVINAVSEKAKLPARFGYINVLADRDTKYLKRGELMRAHEFHHWNSNDGGDVCIAIKPAGGESRRCCVFKKNIFAGYPQFYYRSCPQFAKRFVDVCAHRSAFGGLERLRRLVRRSDGTAARRS